MSEFHSFKDDHHSEPISERIQIWNQYDNADMALFFIRYGLMLLIAFGVAILLVEAVRFYREYANAASPFKLYKTSPRIVKKKE